METLKRWIAELLMGWIPDWQADRHHDKHCEVCKRNEIIALANSVPAHGERDPAPWGGEE